MAGRGRGWWVAVAVVLAVAPVSAGEVPGYGIARYVTPVFNSSAFPRFFGGTDGATLITDQCGQMRSLEFMAPKGSVFTILGELSVSPVPVYRVTTDEYPYPTSSGYYVDGRFLDLTPTRPPERQRILPPVAEIIRRMLAAVGRPYVWGGNVSAGIAELPDLYPPSVLLTPDRERAWTLAGLDCSGLLYEATSGFTPRNTSVLVGYGAAVPIAGLNARAIAARVRPLDLIVWNGHVMIVIDRSRVIESRLVCGAPGNGGVRVSHLEQTLADVMRRRRPADAYPQSQADGSRVFVIRRWYTGSSNF